MAACWFASSYLLLLLQLLLGMLPLALSNSRDICKRDPPGTAASRTPGDNGFRIKIVGRPQPERYAPEQVYTVVINGTYPNQRLLGFMLVAVPLNAKDESTPMGTFQHLSTGATKFAEECPYVVTHTYPNPKAGVEVLWTAPPAGTGCIEFRATVIEYNDIWYKDDGALTAVFCEETGTTENNQSPEMIPDCCACGTAKYQMTFHGTWSHRTHPKAFPQKKRLLHWSNIVGASHSKHYTIWKYGGYATEGVRQVCEFAYTRILEEEMRQHSRDVRTVVKTPGIWWSDPHGLEQTRWARFSVDKKNHLVSMLSMLGPSPDWCVGVSALNLCLPNCTWIGEIEMKLYPWDAGTDDGVTYMSTNKRSNPQQKIHKITNTFPNNPQSPFFGPTPIKPLATLKIRRIHPKIGEDMVCTGQEEDFDLFDDDIEDSDDLTISEAERKKRLMLREGKCAMSEWSDWSMCSVTCGVGQMFRKRAYLNKEGSEDTCGEPTVESENCIGIETECEKPGEECAVSRWSDWSPCSVTCGKGTKERRRFYYDPEDERRCDRKLVEVEICTAPIQDCSKAISMLNFTAICSQPKNVGRCRADFTRYYYDTKEAKCLPFSYTGCRGNNNNFMTEEECLEMCFPVMQEAILKKQQEKEKSEDITDVVSPLEEIDIKEEKDDISATKLCSLPSVAGPCKARLTRYYFDSALLTCVPFRYGGCKGNENNFLTEDQCMDTCFMVMQEEMRRRRLQQDKQLELEGRQQHTEEKSNQQIEAEKTSAEYNSEETATKKNKKDKGKKHKKHKDKKESAVSGPGVGAKVDCVITEWSGWSTCSATCGRGYKFKRRTIKQEAQNGGKKCPRKLEKKKRCKMPKCKKGRHQQEVGVTMVTRAEGQGEGRHQNHGLPRVKRDVSNVEEHQNQNADEVIRNDVSVTSSTTRKKHSEMKNKGQKKGTRKKKRRGKKGETLSGKKPKRKHKPTPSRGKSYKNETVQSELTGIQTKSNMTNVNPGAKPKHRRQQNSTHNDNKQKEDKVQKTEKKLKQDKTKPKLERKKASKQDAHKKGKKKKSRIKGRKKEDKLKGKGKKNKVKGKDKRKSTNDDERKKVRPAANKTLGAIDEKLQTNSNRSIDTRLKMKKDEKKAKPVDDNKVSGLKESEKTTPKKKRQQGSDVTSSRTGKKRNSKKTKDEKKTASKRDKTSKNRRKKKRKSTKHQGGDKQVAVTPGPTDSRLRVRDCVITGWSDWSHCSVTCGRGFQFKRRIIEAVEKNGGKPCPTKLEIKRRCVLDKCPDERCKMSEWGPWTPCPKTCGSGSIQERTRQVLAAPGGDTSLCGARIERRYCTLPPCPRQLGRRHDLYRSP